LDLPSPSQIDELPPVEHLFPSGTHVQRIKQKQHCVLKGSTGYMVVSPTRIRFSEAKEINKVTFEYKFFEIPAWSQTNL